MTDPPTESDTEVPEDRCGYTYPEDSDIERDPDRVPKRNSCIRHPLPDSDRCAVHADPEETDHKREQLADTDSVGGSLDGAILPGWVADSVDFSEISLLRDADLSEANLNYSDLPGAKLLGANLPEAKLRDVDLSEANLNYSDLSEANLNYSDLSEANLNYSDLPGAKLLGTNLPEAKLRDVDLSEAKLGNADLSGATLKDVDLSGAYLAGADLPTALLSDADLSGADLSSADLSGANLTGANLSEALLSNADLTGADLDNADLSGAYLQDADLLGAELYNADLSRAHLQDADLSRADLRDADLSGADLRYANLPEANLERATIVEVNLFDTDLTKITPYGARLEAVQINDGTEFYEESKEYSRWWQREGSLLAAPPRCGYDPIVEHSITDLSLELHFSLGSDEDQTYFDPPADRDTDRETSLTRAADTYRQFEELARQNTQSSLQSSFFVLRQDMQRKRYRERGKYTQWLANLLFRIVFKHGESFARLLVTAAVLILAFAGGYWQLDLIINNPDAPQSEQEFINDPLDAIYFSTLTFTTLGLGDFQPAVASQLGRGLVLLQAVLGAILIATFVFVLGRRAAR